MNCQKSWTPVAIAAPLISLPLLVSAAGVPGAVVKLDTVTVTANQQLVGEPDSATIGTVDYEQIENRPLSRPGEVLEVVPGLIITQHSGEGKANQYFLRGYNLDHGTDFAVTVDGLPVNMPTHGHGHGWSDTNFMIPELIDSIEYRKGPYYAQYGDFSGAGAADIRYRDQFDQQKVELTGGAFGYGRLLSVGSTRIGTGNLVYGLEGVHYDGPYDLKQSFNKGNVVLRYSQKHAGGGYHVSASGYQGRWLAPDQIPQRAVERGEIDLYGFIDPTDGGVSSRYNLAGGFDQQIGPGRLTVAAYAFRYKLDLFSNFTYFLDDPDNGDQFEQFDDRNVYGGSVVYKLSSEVLGYRLENELGLQTRFDDIQKVGLYLTRERQRRSTVTESEVKEWSGATYAQSAVRFLPWFRATLGVRADSFDFGVKNTLAANTGSASDTLISPKLALVFGPFNKTEFFINAGQGFHSNDARGATQSIDPRSGDAIDPVTPLAPQRGVDLGVRTAMIPKVQIAASVFRQTSEGELIYVGDAGTTEPFGAAIRYGGELAVYWRPVTALVIDGDLAYTQARFRDSEANGGEYLPQAINGVAALGATYESPAGWDASLRTRYFGPRTLTEDNSIKSKSTTTVNVGAGYKLGPKFKIDVQITNLLNSKDHDIDYFYESRLQSEPAGSSTPDIHFHVIEPINARMTITYTY